MENWGLITYREADILVDPADASISVQHDVTVTVVHEMAHQVDPCPPQQAADVAHALTAHSGVGIAHFSSSTGNWG